MPTNINDRSLSGNDFGVYLSPQTNSGEVDENPKFDKFRRLTGRGKKTIAYNSSEEVKSNRQARAAIKDTFDYTAELAAEMWQSCVPYLEAAMHGAPEKVTVIGSDISITSAGVISLTSGAFNGLSVGDYIWVTGYSNALLNRSYRVTGKVGADAMQLYPNPVATENAGASVTISRTVTGTGDETTLFTIQTRRIDKSAPNTDEVDYYTQYDSPIDTASFSIEETGTASVSINALPSRELSSREKIAGQEDNDDDVSIAISNVNDVVAFYVNGVNSDCNVKSMGFDFVNNYQEDRAAACSDIGRSYGDIGLTGALVTRAKISNSGDWERKFNDGERISLAVHVKWEDGNEMIVEVLRAVITEHDQPDGSNVIAANEMSYQAEEDPVTGLTARLWRNF